MARFKCPECSSEKSKKEIDNIKSIYGLGFEYICSECNSKVIHPPLGQIMLIFASIPIIVINWPGNSWTFELPFVAFGLLVLSGIFGVLGFKNMKPYVEKSNT